jgi:hypothetical protein
MSTTATGTYPCDNSSLTNFKAWGTPISAAFSAFGWTQTSDTGQINWSTIGAVPSNAYPYEVWKAADAAASTTPIYVKIGYGYSTTAVGIQITVGTGSNGSGTITGIISGYSNVSIVTGSFGTTTLANQGATLYNSFFSGTAGEMRMLLWVGSTAAGVQNIFAIERSKDSSGNPTTAYFSVLYASDTNLAFAQRQQSVLTSGATPGFETGIISFGPTAGTGTGSFNGTVAAYPVFPLIGSIGNPMLGMMSAAALDVANGTTVTVSTLYGSTHTYIACKSLSGFTNGIGGIGTLSIGGVKMAVLMRYE